MKFNKYIASIVAVASFALVFSTASAHVSVQPKEVGVSKFQSFSVGVPVERDVPTVALRLVIPAGLGHVTPNVKPGWKIAIKHAELTAEQKAAGEDHGEVTEISWTGGTIPAGQRDDFAFSAQAPAEATTLVWKAYQTYQDGTVVSWELGKDQVQPQKDGKPDFSQFGPASETKIINDLAPAGATQTTLQADDQLISDVKSANRNGKIALAIGVVGFLLAAASLYRKP